MKKDTTHSGLTSCCGHDSDAPTPTPETCTCSCKTCRKPRYWLWILGFALFYVLSVIPVGIGLYALKSQAGIELLKHGGYHAALRCLQQATQRNF